MIRNLNILSKFRTFAGPRPLLSSCPVLGFTTNTHIMDTTRVKVAQGEIKGVFNKTASEFEYISFNGIPYAKPPIGDLRFRNPQPADRWTGIWDGSYEREMCSQYDSFITKQCVGSEDCLYLNIHVPKLKKSDTLTPVLIWIHGGAFQLGSASAVVYGPDFFVEQNIIVVTINYRLGPLGFLCLNIPEAPGNLGLKDQALAIKWIKNNIINFGGDSNNMTLMGESAGAVCVQLQVISPVTSGLVQKAICSSGSCLSNWAIKEEPEINAWKIAENLNFSSKNKLDLLKFLKNVPALELVESVRDTFKNQKGLPFSPVIERSYKDQESFLTQHPSTIIKSGSFCKIPMINGFNSNEGLYFALPPMVRFDEKKYTVEWMDKYIKTLDDIIPYEIKEKNSELKKIKIINDIKQFYINPENVFKSFVDFMTDTEFALSIRSSCKMFSKSAPVYFYCFSYNGSINLLKMLSGKNYEGAGHSDELPYLFDNKILLLKDTTPTEKDLQMRNKLINLFTNFIKYSDPTPNKTNNVGIKWIPFKENEENCMIIDDDLKMSNILSKRFLFWDKLILESKL